MVWNQLLSVLLFQHSLIHPSCCQPHPAEPTSAPQLGQAPGLQLPSESHLQTLLLKLYLTGESTKEPCGAQHTWDRAELALPALPTLAKCFRCHSEALQSPLCSGGTFLTHFPGRCSHPCSLCTQSFRAPSPWLLQINSVLSEVIFCPQETQSRAAFLLVTDGNLQEIRSRDISTFKISFRKTGGEREENTFEVL